MIRAKFVFDRNKNIRSFYLTGHADYAEAGKDIYCSAVSAIAQTVIGTLTEVLKAGQDFIYQCSEGEIECTILDEQTLTDKQKIQAQTLMLSAYVGMKQIEMIEEQKYLSILKEEDCS